MIELSTHIEYMLLTHDEVSVPQLGTFIVKDMSSRRVDEEGIFLPPYRTVSFQWDEQEAGEDFISSLSKLHNLSRYDARMMCVEYADELQQALEEDGTASMGGMGYLLRDADSQEVCFVPIQSGIASPAYYGLDAIPFSKLSHEARQHRDKKQKGRKTRLTSIAADADTIIIRINRRVFNYVGAVAASIVLFFTFTSPYSNPVAMGGGQKAESVLTAPLLLPRGGDTKHESRSAEEVKQISVEEVSPREDLEGAAPAKEVSPRGNCPLVAEQLGSVSDGGPKGLEGASSPYVIVLASAISEKSAISYAGRLQEKGYNAQACEFGGMVRVIIPGFATQDDAYAEIRRMKADDNSLSHAWPCQVKDEVKPIE